MKPQVKTIAEALAVLHGNVKEEFSDLDPKVKGYDFKQNFNFERDFPNFCFALATGVGKTRLMGAFIAYLKPWTYVFIPHNAIQENISLDSLTQQHKDR